MKIVDKLDFLRWHKNCAPRARSPLQASHVVPKLWFNKILKVRALGVCEA